MRIMAIDVGTKRIGVAFSDPLGIIANPWGFVEAEDTSKAVEKLRQMMKENSVNVLVVGLPINMDGSIGQKAEECKAFAELVRKDLDIKVNFVDERLSSREIEGMLIDSGVRREKRKKINDKLCAALILQKYLDAEKREFR